jgi:superfamily II DNA or RNA helicase
VKFPHIYGKIGACLTIENCPQHLSEEILRIFTFSNPEYKTALRFSPSGYISKSIPALIVLARRKKKSVMFPRGIRVTDLDERAQRIFDKVRWLDLRTTAPVKFPKLIVGLNREQRIVLRHFKKLREDKKIPFGNFLFVKPTSTGKTISQAAIARLTHQRTLIICVTNQIRNSWFNDLRSAFGLASKDIGLIQQGVWRIGKWFTLASIATIRKREHRWTELFEEFGTVILDEAHTVTQPSLYSFLMSHPAKYLIGATATDRREGGRNFYLTSTFGRVSKRITAQQKETETSLPLSSIRQITTDFEYEYQQQNLDSHDLNEHIISDEARNQLIVDNVYKDWKKGHSVLLVSYRLAHIALFKDMLEEAGIDEVNILTGETNTNRKYTENLRELVMSGKCRCLVASVRAIMLGANFNPIDRLHLGMPVINKVDLEQLIGRIRRKAVDKTECELVYYLDSKVAYLLNVWKYKATAVFRKLKVPEFKDTFII